jgi:hypothetical protein
MQSSVINGGEATPIPSGLQMVRRYASHIMLITATVLLIVSHPRVQCDNWALLHVQMLCLWGILTFLFFLASLSLNLGLQVTAPPAYYTECSMQAFALAVSAD